MVADAWRGTVVSQGARSVILGRIRDAAGARAGVRTAWHDIPRPYAAEGGLDSAALVELFSDRLEHYQVRVYRTIASMTDETVAAALQARGKRRLLVPADIETSWLPPEIQFHPDVSLTYGELDASEGVLTTCSLAIANTGTIVLTHGRGEGRRALTLIPDYHLCVVVATQIVQTVPEAFRRLHAQRPRLITTISGPSATADIEMTRIRGVHGPRTLDVIIAAG
jgi:L-lactate dehydrogenase complex protein LldG